jgi:hypothetical protein
MQGTAVFLLLIGLSFYYLFRCYRLALFSEEPLESRLMTYGCLVSLVTYLVAAIFTDRLYTESYWWVIALPVCLHRTLIREASATTLVPALVQMESEWKTPIWMTFPSAPPIMPPIGTFTKERPEIRSTLGRAECANPARHVVAGTAHPGGNRHPVEAARGQAGPTPRDLDGPEGTARVAARYEAVTKHVIDPSPFAERVIMPSGLRVQDLEVGVGVSPGKSSKVTVDYVGYFDDGVVFDKGNAVQLDLATVFDELAEGILTMREAGRRRLFISPGALMEMSPVAEGGTPADQRLIFEITLLRVNEVPSPGMATRDV